MNEEEIKILLDRLEREIKSHWSKEYELYLCGYAEAIHNILWDITKIPLKSLYWEEYNKTFGSNSSGIIPIDKIKTGGRKNG